ncbi:conserved Plasmodium protein, unknown function [Plasmodium ovale]|uniref:Uncharacterized protein n=1 Tax=Plasmodium ovale TaxID=36330 RepID=A0A1C3KPX9_PLAOA|nr:conserved Plasmodium protein, unknown function [Plasmodium ovale]
MCSNRGLVAKGVLRRTTCPFGFHEKWSSKSIHRNFSTKKILIYEHVNNADFLLQKSNSVESLVNYNYVKKKMNEINSYLRNGKKDDKCIDKIIENLYMLCVKGNIDICDERIKYYVGFVLSHINDYVEGNIHVGTCKVEEKRNTGRSCQFILSIKSYLLFLHILRSLNMKKNFDNLLKYASQNIHFFSIDVVRKIAFHHGLNREHNFFFKELLSYVYTLIQCNSEIYFKEIKNVNTCINICTNFFFGKKYMNEKKMYDYEMNEDIIYLYNMNYIYINHIVTVGNIIHGNIGMKVEIVQTEEQKKNYPRQNILEKNSEQSGNFADSQKKNKERALHVCGEKGTDNAASLGENKVENKNEPEIVCFTKNSTKENPIKSVVRKHENERVNKRGESHENVPSSSIDKPQINATLAKDFCFNYQMVDTIYAIFNYYTNLSSKKKNVNKELFFFYIPDIRNNIMNIILNFINTINSGLTTNGLLKNKKIIASLERVLKLGTEFRVPFQLEPFVMYHCNVLLVSKFDLSLLDNIKMLTLFRKMSKTQEREAGKVNQVFEEHGNVNRGTYKHVEEKNRKDYEQLAKIENNQVQGKKKKKINSSVEMFNALSLCANDDNKFHNINNLFDNMIKLIFENLKKCMHNSKSNDVCLFMPIVYEFHKYMDEELKNILTVQVTCNKDSINEENMINVLRVFSKIKYKNDIINKFVYKSAQFLPSGESNELKDDHSKNEPLHSHFSCPKIFFLFFYYKSKNNVFSYKDIYYVENYIQNSLFELNIKDFTYVLLIYYKNKIVLLPQLLLKICVIFNNSKKTMNKDELLFSLFLLSTNYHFLSQGDGHSVLQREEDITVLNKINLVRKNQYTQHDIDNFISIINDILLYLYSNKSINYQAEEVQHASKNQDGSSPYEGALEGEEAKNGEKDVTYRELYAHDRDTSYSEKEEMNNCKVNFNKLKYNRIMMKIFYNLYHSYFRVEKKKKKILNSHHEKLLSHLFTCFNNNFSKNAKEINNVLPLLYHFSYFHLYSPFYFEKQISYVLQNCVIDDKVVRHLLLSHVCTRRKIPGEIKKDIKEYVINNFEHFSENFQVLCFKHCNLFLNVEKVESTNEKNDNRTFDQMLNYLLLNLGKMKAKHYLDIYITISNHFVKAKKCYIQLFYYMNRCATCYNYEQLFVILFYMYKTGYSKPKIRKKIRNLILYYHKNRKIGLHTYTKFILPLDEFGIFHLFPVKFQNIIYNQLSEDVKERVRKPLSEDAVDEAINTLVTREENYDTAENERTEKKHAPIYVFEQMVKNY